MNIRFFTDEEKLFFDIVCQYILPMTIDTQIYLEVANVTFAYHHEQQVFSDLNFSLPVGGAGIIAGPVGSGKTTLVRLVSGLLSTDSGQINIAGEPVSKMNITERTRMLSSWGMILESPHLLADRSIRDNISASIRLSSSRIRTERSEVDSMLRQFGLVEKARRNPGTLSQGEQKLVQLVMACTRNPAFLIWDDPDSALDEAHLNVALELVRRRNLAGTTLLITSSRPDKYRELGWNIYDLPGANV